MQKGARPVIPGLAIDVGVVVGHLVEAGEGLTIGIGPCLQVGVEHLLPGGGVDGGRPGQDPVEVEEAGPYPLGQAQSRGRAHVGTATGGLTPSALTGASNTDSSPSGTCSSCRPADRRAPPDIPQHGCKSSSCLTCRAISRSSLASTTSTAGRTATAEITPSPPRPRSVDAAISTPGRPRPAHVSARSRADASPASPANTGPSMPPIAATMAATLVRIR